MLFFSYISLRIRNILFNTDKSMVSFSSDDDQFLEKLRRIVLARMSNTSFGVSDLASEIGMSRSNLLRRVKEITGKTVVDLMCEIRLQKASELMKEGKRTVAEIAYDTGFGSPAYFTKCFHEYFGYAPADYRKKDSTDSHFQTDHQETEQENESEVQKLQSSSSPGLAKTTRKLNIIVFSIILVAILFALLKERISEIRFSDVSEKSIAVLPFEYLGEDSENQFQADGIRSIIQSHLSKISDLIVMSEESSNQYKNTQKTAQIVGKELDVNFLLKGNLMRFGDELKLVLTLIDANNDKIDWSNEYNGDRGAVCNELSSVAEEVANKLHAKITSEEKKLIQKTPSTNFTASDYCQRGKIEFEKGRNKRTYIIAQNLFQKALKCDSAFSSAYSGLARVYWEKHHLDLDLSVSYRDSAFQLANLAIAYDEHNADAYLVRGWYYNETGHVDRAINEFDKAINYDPNNWKAHYARISVDPGKGAGNWIIYLNEVVKRYRGEDFPWILQQMGWGYLNCGFPEQTRKIYKEVLELTLDTAAYLYRMQWLEFCTENFEEAYRYAKKCCEFDSTFLDGESIMYYTYAGHHEEAYEYAKKYIEHCKKTGQQPDYLLNVGYAYRKVGKKEEAKVFFNRFLELLQKENSENDVENHIKLDHILIYLAIGDKEKAFNCMTKFNCKTVQSLWILTMIKSDPIFDSIIDDPRYQRFVQDCEAVFRIEHEKAGKNLKEHGML